MAYYPGVYNFTLFRGTTLRQSFVRKQSRTGPTFNLSGYGVQGQIHLSKAPELNVPPVMSLAVSTGELSIDGPSGLVELFIPPEKSNQYLNTRNVYYYWIQLVQPNGDVVPYLYGSISVVQSATR